MAVEDGPVEVTENDSRSVLDGYLVHLDDLLRGIIGLCVGKIENLLFPFSREHAGGEGRTRGEVFTKCFLWSNLFVVHLYYMCDEIRNIIHLRQDEDDLQGFLLRYQDKQFLELFARLLVKSDKRIVHDEHTWLRQEGSCQLELSHLATGE